MSKLFAVLVVLAAFLWLMLFIVPTTALVRLFLGTERSGPYFDWWMTRYFGDEEDDE